MILYPPNEESYKIENDKLLYEWRAYIKNNEGENPKYPSNRFVFDGFYPYYYSQKSKILFIGKESRGLAGSNYIDVLYKVFKTDKTITMRRKGKAIKKSIDGSPFHKHMLKIAYGLLNNSMEWKKIPKAIKIADISGVENGISFAFMNFSKFDNVTKIRNEQKKQIEYFVKISKTAPKNYWNEQIKLLAPDIIITMNLSYLLHELELKKDDFKRFVPKCLPKEAGVYSIIFGDKEIKIIDTYHFSSTEVNDTHFYQLICNALKK